MKVRSVLSKPFASYIFNRQKKWMFQPVEYQHQVFEMLLKMGKSTIFGEDHRLSEVQSYEEFKQAVPVRDYEDIRPYIDKILAGENDVLWQGKPAYFAKTSGTTSGVKYIPITRDSIPNHINGARDALLNYIHETGKADFIDGKLIFLSGSPTLDKKAGINTGRLSGIVNHHVPAYLRTNQMPSYKTNCIEDWEEKLNKIIDETIDENMTLISGIPPWVQMYFDRIIERRSGKIKDIFPNFNMFVYGGVNFEPYRSKLFDTIGRITDSIETYPASEGFIAFQDSQEEKGLLLLLNSGIFYEFIAQEDFHKANPPRLSIGEVTTNVNYAIVINSSAGLWGYSLGDTVKFTSLNPYRLVVTGRIKHFISAFGEHVIAEEVEKGMKTMMEAFPETELVEFTVAPMVTPGEGLPHHEWYIEFSRPPQDLPAFEKGLNLQLQKLNTYYDDLIQGNILQNLRIICLQRDAFRDYMKSEGKLGGQNKVPRLSNDRKLADVLIKYKI